MSARQERGVARLATLSAVLQATNVVVLLLTTMFLSRQLGVVAFGEYVLVLTVVTLSETVVVFGLPTFLTRELSAELSVPNDQKCVFGPARLVQNAILTSVILFACIATLLVGIQAFWPSLNPTSARIAPLVVILGRSILQIHAGALVGLGRIRRGLFSRLLLLNAPFLFLLAVGPHVLGETLSVAQAFQFQMIAVWFGAAISAVWTWYDILRYPSVNGQHTAWIVALRACVPLALVNGLASLQQNMVFFILGGLLSPGDVGVYRIAERIGATSQFFRSALQSVLEPKVSRSWREGTLPETARLMRKVTLIDASFNVALLFLFGFLGQELIRFAFGAGAVPAWGILLILLIGFSVTSLFGINGLMLSMTSHADRLFRALVLSLIIFLFLLFPLTMAFGISGAAAATASYTIITGFLLWSAARKSTGVNISLFRAHSK